MPQLGIKLDHVASLRQARRAVVPDPVIAAGIAEIAGADSIVVHLCEDRRHVQERDVRLLRQTVKTTLNLAMAPTQEMLKLAYDIKPDVVTLVPEFRDGTVIEGGYDINYHRDHARKYIQSLRDADVAVAVFLDPDIEQIRSAHRVDVSSVVLDTRKFAQTRGDAERTHERQRLYDAARSASKLNMNVGAGQGLDQHNLPELVALGVFDEFQIGHAVVAQSVIVGLECAVRDMRALLTRRPS